MNDLEYLYEGPPFNDVFIKPIKYNPDFFEKELSMESDAFLEIRESNKIYPYRIDEGSDEEKLEIKNFFNENKNTFYFLFHDEIMVGSILFIHDYIQCLTIDPTYQNKGYGTQLTKFAINKIFGNGYSKVRLSVLEGNIKAKQMYEKLGFGRCGGDVV